MGWIGGLWGSGRFDEEVVVDGVFWCAECMKDSGSNVHQEMYVIWWRCTCTDCILSTETWVSEPSSGEPDQASYLSFERICCKRLNLELQISSSMGIISTSPLPLPPLKRA
jgi:hypothetical protein